MRCRSTTLKLAVRKISESAMLVGTVLGLVGVAAYYASKTAFEMLYLSNQYVAATTDAQGPRSWRRGRRCSPPSTATAFHLSINLFSINFLIVSVVVLQSHVFGRATAHMGILAAIFS